LIRLDRVEDVDYHSVSECCERVLID
jgi:hypothetical protein